ncbi:hypothetical protein PHMEG_0008154 [Phytophthora megakarya]|uniref:RxLR effector PexRD54 WY domain-containing protein n=1 Tax=Phytophthora megakarya TaxID=4795 RepID=A0A225WJF0_9STRA|nr:hypothetical protein PHMEG_0008154 [Phytophthora megakarya]
MVAKVKLKLTSDNQQATDKLFYGLNVDKVKSNLFENEKFHKWTTSVTKSYSENPLAGDMAMVVTLSARYGDETLASMLTAAKEVKSTKNVAEDMIKAQNLKWAQEGKSTEDVFKILKLDDLFDGPSASRWIGYVTKVSDEDPHKMLFLKLSKQYDDEELAKLIQRTKYSTDEIILVDNLETLLFRRWRNTKKSAEDVYKILRLQDDEATNLLSNPALNIWLEYVRVYVKFEDKYQFLIKKLAKHYDDKNLVNFLLATRKSENTVAIGALLLPKLPEYWLKQGKSSDEIATIWKLSNGGLR